MKIHPSLTTALCVLLIVPLAMAEESHSPGSILFKRTDGLNVGDPNDQFTGALPENTDTELPLGELDDPNSSIITQINVDTHASGRAAGIELEGQGGFPSGDNFDLAFTFQFYDGDGQFSFTENFDDRVQVNITPIVSASNLASTGANGPTHQDTSWNTRTYADYDFGAAGWFHAEIIMSEDGGGAQSAGGIGFGYSNAASTGTEGDYGLIGGGAVFDVDANGQSFGSSLADPGPDPGPDSDGDGIPDTIEEEYFPGDLTQLGPGDFDNDGVNDPEEITDGTDPTVADSDLDGLNDGEENVLGTDPLDSDSDDDGLADGVESNTGIFNSPTDTGTDPLVADSDGDNFSDGDEVSGGTDPTDLNDFPEGPLPGNNHSPGSILFKRTDGLNVGDPNDQFTGALPENTDTELPLGVLDDPNSSIITQINVDSHASGRAAGIELEGQGGFPSADNFDLAFTFQFYDGDGQFSFTENFDDRVQVNITPIVSASNLASTGANGPTHQDTSWNTRTYADYDFGAAGWFHAEIIMSEDGGGAQSAGGIGFGYSNAASTGTEGDYGLIGGGAVFDVDANGQSFGSSLDATPAPGPDSDGDGIPDTIEEQYFPGDLTQLGPGDFDNDGVNDPEEITDGTDPTVADSDLDGLNDGEENVLGTDPLDSDSDDDGLADGVESNTGIFNSPTDTGTDPLVADSDGDNFSDGDEVSGGTDPTDLNDFPEGPLPGNNHSPGSILFKRTDGLNVGDPNDQFTGALPENTDTELPLGVLDDPNSSIITQINVDSHASGRAAGIELEGQGGFPSADNFDLAFTFQFYDGDGQFSFTENFDDRVQVNITPIVSASNLASTGANGPTHQDTSWNTRTYADYDFGAAGWFHAEIIMVEDGGGAQSAGGIGFGYSNAASTGTEGDYGLIGGGAVFDVDANGQSFGSSLDATPAPGPDSDGDGIPDTIEEEYFPGDLTQLGPGDFDNDGVNDPEEITDGTDPTVADSDLDGLNDGEENVLGTDPLDSDSDDDGLADGVESNTGIFNSPTDTGTDPLVADSDGDNFSDGDEVSGGTDPTDETVFPRPPVSPAGKTHSPGSILYRRTDGLNVGGDDFTGALPENLDLEEPLGELDNTDSSIITQINVDTEGGAQPHGIDLIGDNFDLAFTFQFYDGDGQFSFTENFDDRVQVTITPIVNSTDTSATGAPTMHSDVSWNTRTYADFNFASGGWFDAEILMVEDGGGAQSAGGIGFGYSNAASTSNEGDYSLIGAAGGAIFDTDANGQRFGSVICTPPTGNNDIYQFTVSSSDSGANLGFTWNSFGGQQYAIVGTDDPVANPDPSTWPLIPGLESITATPPLNVSSIPKPLAPLMLYKLLAGPIPAIANWDFDASDGGWVPAVHDLRGLTNFEWGPVNGTSGPVSGPDGTTNIWGTSLTANTTPNSDLTLDSPVFNLPVPATLNGMVFLDFDAPGGDSATLTVHDSTDGSQIGGDLAFFENFNIEWETLNQPLPAEAIGKDIFIRVRALTDGALDFGGFFMGGPWSVDAN